MAKYENVTTKMVVEDNTGRLDKLARWRKVADDVEVTAEPAKPDETPAGGDTGTPVEPEATPEATAVADDVEVTAEPAKPKRRTAKDA